MSGRLVLLSAPAGWGKSSLLAEWARQTHLPVAWVDCQRYGGTGQWLVKRIVRALEAIYPDLGGDIYAMLRSARPLPIPQVFAVLSDALEDYGANVALVLDDFHTVEDEEIVDAVYRLVQSGPSNVRLLVASRMTPSWPLSRMRMTGEVVEIGPADLAFAPGEIREFLDDQALPDEAIVALHQRSGGWAAVVQLAQLWLRSHGSGLHPDVIEGTRRDIGEYFAEEVMAGLSADVRRFLLVTSLVERFSVDLAGAMLASDAAGALFEAVERHDLFLLPVDAAHRWYRYHDVFRDFLRDRAVHELGTAREEMLGRAASWLRKQGYVLEASSCYLFLGKAEEAAAILDDCARDLVLQDGEVTSLVDLADQLPADVVAEYPGLQRFYAWALVLVGRLEDADRIARDLEALALSGTSRAGGFALAEAAGIRSRIAAYRGDNDMTIAQASKALDCGDAAEEWFRADAYLSLGFAYRAIGQLIEACEAFGQAATLGWRSRFPNAALWGSRYQALTLVSRGHLADAWSQIAQDMERAREVGMTQGATYAALLVSRGELRYERNELAAARNDLTAALRMAREAGDVKILMNVHLAIAMLEAAEGRREESREAARTAVRIFDGTAEKAIETRLALRFGDLPRVTRWMDEYVALVGDTPSFSHGEAEQLMLARAYLATGQVQRARLFLLVLQQEANGCDRAGTTLIIRAILALVEDSDGHPEQAEEHVRAALDIAMREGFVRSLLDEGPAFLDILRRTNRRDPSAERRDYARSILSSIDHVEGGWGRMAHDGAIEPLTPRQQEVLRLVADGCSNREIADQLYLAEGTVKAHMHQIFNKLMVRNRAEAIRAAQRLGLAS